jgi:hypothetical protein
MELTWDNAKEWQDKANEHKGEDEEPTWSWDCGYCMLWAGV